MYFQKLEFMCIIRFKWREVPVPVVREGNGIAFIQKVWHLYNSTLAFIQFHTGIYTIQHTGIYTSCLRLAFMAICHEHMAFICMLSMAECCPIFLFPSQNSSWHSAMNMCNLNACTMAAAQFFFFLPKTLHGTLP